METNAGPPPYTSEFNDRQGVLAFTQDIAKRKFSTLPEAIPQPYEQLKQVVPVEKEVSGADCSQLRDIDNLPETLELNEQTTDLEQRKEVVESSQDRDHERSARRHGTRRLSTIVRSPLFCLLLLLSICVIVGLSCGLVLGLQNTSNR